jgi:hypothetical protein
MTQIFGDFVEPPEVQLERLVMGFSPTSIPLQQRWRNNGLSADFLADYLSTFFPAEDPDSQSRQDEIKDAVSYIANELLENAMKYNHAPPSYPVSIGMHMEMDRVHFYVSNSVNPKALPDFQAFIKRLLTEDPDEMYMEQLENNDPEENKTGGGLGFLTMLNDYNARLSWKFEKVNDEVTTVTTLVELPLD